MEESFSQWRDSPCVVKDKEKSFVISDSDEEENKNIERKQIFVIESSDSSINVSSNLTPRKSSSEELSLTEETIKKRIKKHIFYSDNEDAKDDEDENDSVSTNDTEEDDTNDNVSNDEQMINISAEIKDDDKESQDALENKENIDDFNISESTSNNNSLTTKYVSKEKKKA